MAFLSRSFRRRCVRLRPLIIAFLAVIFIDAILVTHSLPPPTRVSLSSTPPKDKIFIASMFRNSEYILRASYIESLVALVTYLGPSNVFVSILESGSFDNTKGALGDLAAKLNELGVPNKILVGINHDEQQDMLRDLPPEGKREGWVYTGRPESKSGKEGWEMRRIPYLAGQRNTVMEPLYEAGAGKWDKVLWINDVVFNTEDVLTLLNTNDGDYAAACAIDFHSSPTDYYDTFALRDINGHKTASPSFPYFHTSLSLTAAFALRPIPVQSCWNGLIALPSAPFTHPTSPLRFRGLPSSLAAHHLEASECCLIHADSPLSLTKPVLLNPNVRVAYLPETYAAVNPSDGAWPGNGRLWRGVWANRWARWGRWVVLWSESRVVQRRVEKWMREGLAKGEEREEREERGGACIVNEMQVLYQNGWHHV